MSINYTFGRFVAPMIKTNESSSKASSSECSESICNNNCVRSWPDTVLVSAFFLFLKILSISSKKRIQGLAFLALENSSLILLSLSPTSLQINSLISGQMKLKWPNWAQVLAMAVLPVPGGPYKRIPVDGWIW